MRTRSPLTKTIGVGGTAAQKHFYSYFNKEGSRSVDVEDHLAEHVESDAAPVVRALAAGSGPVQADAQHLARFWAFQIVRSSRLRDLDGQAAAHLGPLLAGFDVVSAVFGGDDPAEWDDEAATELRLAAAANSPAEYLVEPTTNSEIRIMLRWVDDLEDKLACHLEHPDRAPVGPTATGVTSPGKVRHTSTVSFRPRFAPAPGHWGWSKTSVCLVTDPAQVGLGTRNPETGNVPICPSMSRNVHLERVPTRLL